MVFALIPPSLAGAKINNLIEFGRMKYHIVYVVYQHSRIAFLANSDICESETRQYQRKHSRVPFDTDAGEGIGFAENMIHSYGAFRI